MSYKLKNTGKNKKAVVYLLCYSLLSDISWTIKLQLFVGLYCRGNPVPFITALELANNKSNS